MFEHEKFNLKEVMDKNKTAGQLLRESFYEKKNISDVDAFIDEAEKGRNIPLSEEDIMRINDFSKEIESVESEIEDDVISIVTKEKNDSKSERF